MEPDLTEQLTQSAAQNSVKEEQGGGVSATFITAKSCFEGYLVEAQ